MQAYKFDAKPENGVITIPEHYKDLITGNITVMVYPLGFGGQGDKPKLSREEVFGCMRGQFVMADDFDEPLEDFEVYMQ